MHALAMLPPSIFFLFSILSLSAFAADPGHTAGHTAGHHSSAGSSSSESSTTPARASFSVHFPWATRTTPAPHRRPLDKFYPLCGEWLHSPQPFSGYKPTFVSFSGNAGDLVSVHYVRARVPRKREDFTFTIATDVPIAPSGQLCFNVQMPPPTVPASQAATAPEYGVFLFEARDPATNATAFHCSDVKLVDAEDRPQDYPAMCARNNETLIPMPEEYL